MGPSTLHDIERLNLISHAIIDITCYLANNMMYFMFLFTIEEQVIRYTLLESVVRFNTCPGAGQFDISVMRCAKVHTYLLDSF